MNSIYFEIMNTPFIDLLKIDKMYFFHELFFFLSLYIFFFGGKGVRGGHDLIEECTSLKMKTTLFYWMSNYEI